MTDLVALVTVAAGLQNPNASVATGNGKATFHMPTPVMDTVSGSMLVPQTIEGDITNGAFVGTIKIPATDTASLSPKNWLYKIVVSTDVWNATFRAAAPVAGSPTTLGKLWATSPDNPANDV
jgi:hypothetical protein